MGTPPGHPTLSDSSEQVGGCPRGTVGAWLVLLVCDTAGSQDCPPTVFVGVSARPTAGIAGQLDAHVGSDLYRAALPDQFSPAVPVPGQCGEGVQGEDRQRVGSGVRGASAGAVGGQDAPGDPGRLARRPDRPGCGSGGEQGGQRRQYVGEREQARGRDRGLPRGRRARRQQLPDRGRPSNLRDPVCQPPDAPALQPDAMLRARGLRRRRRVPALTLATETSNRTLTLVRASAIAHAMAIEGPGGPPDAAAGIQRQPPTARDRSVPPVCGRFQRLLVSGFGRRLLTYSSESGGRVWFDG